VPRFTDLTADETSDLWLTAQKVGSKLETFHNASSLTLAIQDGPQAGQTVPHVHIHILPRKGGDFEKNDEIYDAVSCCILITFLALVLYKSYGGIFL
jgi:bis(5'-adenosyl)-triphosphatase